MSMQHSILGAALAVAFVLGSAGCQSTGTDSMAQQQPPAKAAGAERSASTPEAPSVPRELPVVYFELDRWDLSSEAQQSLRVSAKQIQAQPGGAKVTIEGHCDDRGSDEYNMALGKRRASVVKRYLVDLGVPAQQLDTVTFGESRPAVRGHDERAWSRNRRSEFRIGVRQATRN